MRKKDLRRGGEGSEKRARAAQGHESSKKASPRKSEIILSHSAKLRKRGKSYYLCSNADVKKTEGEEVLLEEAV